MLKFQDNDDANGYSRLHVIYHNSYSTSTTKICYIVTIFLHKNIMVSSANVVFISGLTEGITTIMASFGTSYE
jgi:hypothetical protein